MTKPTTATVLVVEYVLISTSTMSTAPVRDRHPGGTAAVHDKTLSVIDAHGEIGGYADRVWRRWWYESEAAQ